MKLRTKYINMVQNSPMLQANIAEATDRQIQTVILWATKPKFHYKLLALPALKAIRDFAKVESIDELIEQPAGV